MQAQLGIARKLPLGGAPPEPEPHVVRPRASNFWLTALSAESIPASSDFISVWLSARIAARRFFRSVTCCSCSFSSAASEDDSPQGRGSASDRAPAAPPDQGNVTRSLVSGDSPTVSIPDGVDTPT